MSLSKLLTPSTSITLTDTITYQIHHRNLTDMTFYEIYKNRLPTLSLLGFSVNFESPENSVVFCVFSSLCSGSDVFGVVSETS